MISKNQRQLSVHLRSLLLFVAVVLAGCGGPTVTAETPPEIRYGEDVCTQCGMIISDERYAAGLVVEVEPSSFEHRIFDDVGGMFIFAAEHTAEHGENQPIVSYFVHDYTSLEWIDARSASYISSQSVLTPMGFGLTAFADATVAVGLAETWGGQVLTFGEVQKQGVTLPGIGTSTDPQQ